MQLSSAFLLVFASLALVVVEAPIGAVAYPFSGSGSTVLLVRREEASQGGAGFVNAGDGNGEEEPPPRKKSNSKEPKVHTSAPTKEPIKTGADKSVKDIAGTFEKLAEEGKAVQAPAGNTSPPAKDGKKKQK